MNCEMINRGEKCTNTAVAFSTQKNHYNQNHIWTKFAIVMCQKCIDNLRFQYPPFFIKNRSLYYF